MSTSKTWPGGGTGATPTSYSIPDAGELNWAALSSFLQALGDGAQSTTFQKFAVRVATTSPVTVSATTDCIVVTKLAAPGAVTVNLPAGANKQVFIIVDGTGDAATNNVTINRNGSDTIQGASTLVLNANNEGAILVFNSGDTDWKVLAKINRSPGATVPSAGAVYSNGTTLQNVSLTTGDWLYASNTNVVGKVPIGSNNAIGYVASGIPAWTSTSGLSFNGTTLTTTAVSVTRSVDSVNGLDVVNTNTGNSAAARVFMDTADGAGTNADPHILYRCYPSAGNARLFSFGSDKSDSGTLKITTGTSAISPSSGTVVFSLTSGGAAFFSSSLTVGLSGSAGTINISDASGNNDVVLSGTSACTFTNGITVPTSALGNCYGATYTATIGGVTNVSSSSISTAMYTRLGNIVSVSARIVIGATAGAGAETEAYVTLPVASNFSAAGDLVGSGVFEAEYNAIRIFADTTNDRARITFDAQTTGSREGSINFTYVVI